MASRRKGPDPAEIERSVDEVAAIVRRDGAVLRSRLAKLGVPKAAQPEAIARLERDGIEVTSRVLRVPIERQLEARLRDGALLSMRSLRAALLGATDREAQAAAQALVRAGTAVLVLRGNELSLSAPRDGTLGEPDLTSLERTLAALAKTLKDARKKRAALLRSDVRDALAPFAAASGRRAAPLALSEVLAQAEAQKETGGLVFVPALVRALGGAEARDAVHEVLRDAAARGLVELRPESGLARLSAEDLAFCVPGPQGSRLSWARPIAPEGEGA